MTFDNLIVQRAGAVATVTVNRPKVLNALNAATIRELDQCFSSLSDEINSLITEGYMLVNKLQYA